MSQTFQLVIGMICFSSQVMLIPARIGVHNTTAVAAAAGQTWQQKAAINAAHGMFWDGADFAYEYQGQQPVFSDISAVTAVMGESGIVWEDGDRNWRWEELTKVATALIKLTHRLGGLRGGGRLQALLGHDTIHFARASHSASYPGATAERDLNTISFFDEAFASDRSILEVYGTLVHELAHLIGDNNYTIDGRPWYVAFPFTTAGLGLVAPGTGAAVAGNPEYFAEGVKLWVLPDYPTVWKLDDLTQVNWLAERLAL